MGGRDSRPPQAQCWAQARQRTKRRPRFSGALGQQIDMLIRQAWSPEHIRGRLQHEQDRTIRHEWIYPYIYEDKRAGGELYRLLRGQKKRRKR